MTSKRAERLTHKKLRAEKKELQKKVKDIVRTVSHSIKKVAKKGEFSFTLQIKKERVSLYDKAIEKFKKKGFCIRIVESDEWKYYILTW